MSEYEIPTRDCEHCGGAMLWPTARQRYCGGGCRTAAYRARKAARQAGAAERSDRPVSPSGGGPGRHKAVTKPRPPTTYAVIQRPEVLYKVAAKTRAQVERGLAGDLVVVPDRALHRR